MKIAVFLPNWIGDAVMATPTIHTMYHWFRPAELIGVMKPYVAGALEGNPWFKETLLVRDGTWSGSTWGTAKKLRERKVDLAVLFPNTFRTPLTAWLGKCKRRLGYNRHGRGFLLTETLESQRKQDGTFAPTPIIDDYNQIVERIGCPTPRYRMHLWTTAQDEHRANLVWKASGLNQKPEVILLNPGGAFGAAKHWPTEHFAALAQKLVDQRDCGVLVLCGPNEKRTAWEIVRQARRTDVHALARFPLSLGLTKACVKRATLLVTTDSGPRHFAGAFRRPVVTLFGPTHIEWTETYHPRAFHLQKQMSCGPCQQRTCPLKHRRCMTELTPDEVFAATTQLLKIVTRDQAPRPRSA